MLQFFQLPVPSCKTIYRVRKCHDRIVSPHKHVQQPMERPAPMTCWQIDFKDVSSIPADPEGKRQHVVETLNIIDTGTSVLLDAHVRSDFTAETARPRPRPHPGQVGSPQAHPASSRSPLGGQSGRQRFSRSLGSFWGLFGH
jgi:hypothetical protein